MLRICFSRFALLRLVVSILLNEPNGFCRARLDRALERLGMAWSVYVQTSTGDAIGYATYLTRPEEGSTSGVISTPFSTTLEISNTASDMVIDIQMDASAKWRPVQVSGVRQLSC